MRFLVLAVFLFLSLVVLAPLTVFADASVVQEDIVTNAAANYKAALENKFFISRWATEFTLWMQKKFHDTTSEDLRAATCKAATERREDYSTPLSSIKSLAEEGIYPYLPSCVLDSVRDELLKEYGSSSPVGDVLKERLLTGSECIYAEDGKRITYYLLGEKCETSCRITNVLKKRRAVVESCAFDDFILNYALDSGNTLMKMVNVPTLIPCKQQPTGEGNVNFCLRETPFVRAYASDKAGGASAVEEDVMLEMRRTGTSPDGHPTYTLMGKAINGLAVSFEATLSFSFTGDAVRFNTPQGVYSLRYIDPKGGGMPYLQVWKEGSKLSLDGMIMYRLEDPNDPQRILIPGRET